MNTSYCRQFGEHRGDPCECGYSTSDPFMLIAELIQERTILLRAVKALRHQCEYHEHPFDPYQIQWNAALKTIDYLLGQSEKNNAME